jgi:ribosomal protein S27E
MKRNLRMKCPNCSHWNRVSVNKAFLEQPSPEPKVRWMIPMYQPVQVTKCEKCGRTIAEPKVFIRIIKENRILERKVIA